jgi:hypothetical protein
MTRPFVVVTCDDELNASMSVNEVIDDIPDVVVVDNSRTKLDPVVALGSLHVLRGPPLAGMIRYPIPWDELWLGIRRLPVALLVETGAGDAATDLPCLHSGGSGKVHRVQESD